MLARMLTAAVFFGVAMPAMAQPSGQRSPRFRNKTRTTRRQHRLPLLCRVLLGDGRQASFNRERDIPMRNIITSQRQRSGHAEGGRRTAKGNWFGSVVSLLIAPAFFGLSVASPSKAMAGLVTYDISFTASGFLLADESPAPGIEVTGAFSFTVDPTQSYGTFGCCTNPASAIGETVSYWDVTTSSGTSTFNGIENAWYYAPGSGDDQAFDSTYVTVTGDAQYGGSFNAGLSYMVLTSEALNTTGGTCDQGSFVQVLFGNWYNSTSCSYTVAETDDTSVPEPTTLALLGTGLLGMLAMRRRITG